MLLCITDLDSRVDGVVVVKKIVVVESGGVPQVTLKFPPRPPKITFKIYPFEMYINRFIFHCWWFIETLRIVVFNTSKFQRGKVGK